MHASFEFLRQNPYVLLFFAVGMAVFVGKFSVKGYGLGMVAASTCRAGGEKRFNGTLRLYRELPSDTRRGHLPQLIGPKSKIGRARKEARVCFDLG
jgi:hypothetical protein